MEEGIEMLCDRLRGTDLENEKICLQTNLWEELVNWGKNCLLVKLLLNRYFNREAFKVTMRKLWRPAKYLHFHEMGEGLMLVEFENQNDKIRVAHDGPWHFDRNSILV